MHEPECTTIRKFLPDISSPCTVKGLGCHMRVIIWYCMMNRTEACGEGWSKMGRNVWVIVLLVCVISPLAAQPGAMWQVGYDSTILSQGLSTRVLAGTISLQASLQYPFTIVAASAMMGDEEALHALSQYFLVTACIGSSFPLGSSCTGRIGPKVYGLFSGFGQPATGALGLDVSFELSNHGDKHGLSLGAFIPIVLRFDGTETWAWDVFGFAVSPSVGYWWSM